MPTLHHLVTAGAFVTLHSKLDRKPERRGAILCADDNGVTIRAVTEWQEGSNKVRQAVAEYWPWGSVIYVSEAKPREGEKKLLGGD